MSLIKSIFLFFNKDMVRIDLINYFKLLFIWCPLCSILFVLGFGGVENFTRHFIVSYIISISAATTCFFGSIFINHTYQWVNRKKKSRADKSRVLWGVAVSYFFLIPGLYFGFQMAGRYSLYKGYPWEPPNLRDYSSGIIFGILVSGFFLLFEFIREFKETKQLSEIKLKKLENENLKVKISALTAQMNPHLLFNSLNTIASTISTDPVSAEDMVVKLSELYRGVLKSSRGDRHSLEEELILCKNYLDIEKKRFGHRINYSFDIEYSIDIKNFKIPILILQPLVENAVKHGLSQTKNGGHIDIVIKKEDQLINLRVVDNGVGIHSRNKTSGSGMALVNCESRIKLNYGEEGKFSFFRNEKSETVVDLQIPYQI